MNIKIKSVFVGVSLILLILSIAPVSACEPPGTGTPGFWKNHPEAWPKWLDYTPIAIGDMEYEKFEAIDIMSMPDKKDKTYTMFRALVAAKLNQFVGNEDVCIQETIWKAQGWMKVYASGWPYSGTTVKANSFAWQEKGESLYEMLDDYNNGELCAPSRDTLE